jgi:hypothetical protein
MPRTKYGSGAFEKQKVRRKGVHAKSKNSSHKHGKYYSKAYRGQGK